MVEGKYPTAFPLKHQQKDLRLALQAAFEGGLKLPVAAAANNLYVEVGSSHWMALDPDVLQEYEDSALLGGGC